MRAQGFSKPRRLANYTASLIRFQPIAAVKSSERYYQEQSRPGEKNNKSGRDLIATG